MHATEPGDMPSTSPAIPVSTPIALLVVVTDYPKTAATKVRVPLRALYSTLSMALNIGDIIIGVRLALKIYDRGFNQENAADVRYKNFQNDIFNFRHLLEKLDDALFRAQQRYLGTTTTSRVHAYEPLSKDFDLERQTIIGNFIETLEACESLLEENKKFRARYSNVLENLRWHLAQQDRRVDDLRSRLHFHSEKISLVMDRLSINLLTDLDCKVDDLRALAEQNLEVSTEIRLELGRLHSTVLSHLNGRAAPEQPGIESSHNVSVRIAQKFEHYLSIDAPPSMSSDVPLIQGFDAVYMFFEQSTSSSDHKPETYLSFLKTRWLLERLTASPEFHSARPGYYYKRAVNQVNKAVKVVMRQTGLLIAYDEDVLMDLSDTYFRIWPPAKVEPKAKASEPHPLMIRANEVKVMSMALASDEDSGAQDTVTIFKSSDERFRIALQTTLPSRSGEKILVPLTVHVHEDKLMPHYAIPSIAHPEPELAIFSRNEETLYRFKSFPDLYRFQTALTGYDVSHDQEGIWCQFSQAVSSLDCRARVQLWQESIVFGNGIGSDGASSGNSSSLTDGSRSQYDSLAATVVTSNLICFRNGVWEAESIKLPAITIFTELVDVKKKTKRFAILFIELDVDAHVDPTKCSCCRNYNECSKLVLVAQKKKTLTVRALFSDVNSSGQSGFDLLPFRVPRHPDFRNLQTWRTDYLLLKFGTLKAKEEFDKELHFRFRVRDAQVKKQQDFRNEMHQLGDQRQRQRMASLSPTSVRANERLMSSSSSICSEPPTLEIPEADSGLGIGHNREGRLVYETGNGDNFVSSPTDIGSTITFPSMGQTAPPYNSLSLRRGDSGVQPATPTERSHLIPTRMDSRQRQTEVPRSRAMVESVETVRTPLESDLPVTRGTSGKKKGLWKSFKF